MEDDDFPPTAPPFHEAMTFEFFPLLIAVAIYWILHSIWKSFVVRR